MGSTVFPAAASGPTLTDITTAGNNAGWGANNPGWGDYNTNWTYIGAFTLGSSSLTYSGISGYKKLRILAIGLERGVATGSADLRLKINNDADTLNYIRTEDFGSSYTTTDTYDAGQAFIIGDSFICGNGYSIAKRTMNIFEFIIDNCNNTEYLKPWRYQMYGHNYAGAQKNYRGFGLFRTTGQAITSFNIQSSDGSNISTVTAPRGIFLYGAN